MHTYFFGFQKQDFNCVGSVCFCQALHLYIQYKHHDIGISFFSAVVSRGISYKNNSIVTLENIGEGRDALLCITNQSACCRPPYTGEMGTVLGNWYFPNGTVVFSIGVHSDIYRTRGQMVVLLHRRRGGEEGIYRCVIPDAMNVIQTIYIGVYSASTSEYTWFVYFLFNWWMLCACYSIKKFEVFGLSGLSYSLLFSTFKADQHKV